MKKRKIIRDISLVIMIICLSYGAFTPIKVQADDITDQTLTEVGNKRLGLKSEQLRTSIINTSRELAKKHNDFKERLQTMMGTDTSKAQLALNSLSSQIMGLQAIQVPNTPKDENQLIAINKKVMATRLETWKQATLTAKELWKINQLIGS